MEVSLACVVVQSAGRTVAGWWLGGAVRCGCLAGSVLWGLRSLVLGACEVALVVAGVVAWR